VVRKLDPNPLPLLIEEMQSRSPLRRRYAVMAAGAMGLASEVEPQIRHLLSDTDLMVRKETERVYAECRALASNASI
jgi:HEAT repeat protein